MTWSYHFIMKTGTESYGGHLVKRNLSLKLLIFILDYRHILGEELYGKFGKPQIPPLRMPRANIFALLTLYWHYSFACLSHISHKV